MNPQYDELMRRAREERAEMLKEAREFKDRIIEEAKAQAKSEANKIVVEAQELINHQKQQALNEVEKAKENTLAREIDFPADLAEAGPSLLNHFSSLINAKYSGREIRIRIEQIRTKVRLSISAPDGKVMEMIEEDLSLFGKIIKGEKPIEELTNDPLLVLKFKQRIELLSLELKMTRQINEGAMKSIQKLETEKEKLYGLIDRSFSHISKTQDVLTELMQESLGQAYVYQSLAEIRQELAKQNINEAVIIEAMKQLKETSPEKARRVGEFLLNFFSSIGSGVLVEWIKIQAF